MTADTYSNGLGYLVMGTGNDNNSWGSNANSAVFQIFEDAIANTLVSTVTGGTLDLSGTPPPAAASQTRFAILSFIGALTSNQIVIVPNLPKIWWVQNATSGSSYTLTLKTPTGTVVAVLPQDADVRACFCSSNGIYLGQPQLNALVQSGFEQAYAGIDLPSGGWLWEDGTAYSRTTYANLLGALSKTCTGSTHTNTTIDNLSVDLRGKGLEGAYIEGTGITTGTTISSIGSATSLTLSQAATGTAAGVSLRILPHGQGDGSTTFNVPDRRYRALVGRDNMNNNAAGRSSSFAGTHLNTAGGEETHILTVAESAALTYAAGTGIENQSFTHNFSWSGTTGGQSADHSHVYTRSDSGSSGAPGGGGLFLGSQVAVASGGVSNDHTHNYSGSSTTGNQNQNHNHNFSGTTTGGGGAHNNMPPFGITNWIIKQ